MIYLPLQWRRLRGIPAFRHDRRYCFDLVHSVCAILLFLVVGRPSHDVTYPMEQIVESPSTTSPHWILRKRAFAQPCRGQDRYPGSAMDRGFGQWQ
jgi:hypothetical protein